jgi:tetratricopeptide (TPR) repeat protein
LSFTPRLLLNATFVLAQLAVALTSQAILAQGQSEPAGKGTETAPAPVQAEPATVQTSPDPAQAMPAPAQFQPAPSPSPMYPPPTNTSMLRRGTQLIDSGRLNDALALFQDYCARAPQDPSGYFWMGVCFDEMNNSTAAVKAYRDAASKAEQTAMDSSEIRTNLGNALLKLNEIDQAIESYKRALELNPLYGLAELNLGRAFIARNDFQSALAAFDKCDEMHVSVRQLPYYRAKALLQAGKKDEARATVQKFLQDFPAGETRTAIEQEFQSCQPDQK